MIFLTVPFRDKDIVKQLGARWNYEKRMWYINEDMPQDRFSRWIKDQPKEEKVGNVSELKGTEPQEEQAVPMGAPLSSLLFEISEVVRKGFSQARWVMAEISSVRKAVSGHYYLELVEHDHNGKEIAKVSAKIWSNNAKIVRAFEKQTQGSLEVGMKILAQVNAEFSMQYGFSFTIEQLNASWTLGEMELARRKIRAQLQEQGLWDLNRQFKLPVEFVRVAVIAPEGAAGLGDFISDAKVIEDLGLCKFDVFYATFEGVGAKNALVQAFNTVAGYHQTNRYDVVVVIRGGGASASLNWLNDLAISSALAQMPLPVFTGIGHERDDTILDEISARRFDTPSKVIAFISQCIIQNALNAKVSFMDVLNQSEQVLVTAMNDSERRLDRIQVLAQKQIEQVKGQSDYLSTKVLDNTQKYIDKVSIESKHLMQQVMGLGPQSVLSRGYAVVRQSNVVIGKKDQMVDAVPLEIIFQDGVIQISGGNISEQ